MKHFLLLVAAILMCGTSAHAIDALTADEVAQFNHSKVTQTSWPKIIMQRYWMQTAFNADSVNNVTAKLVEGTTNKIEVFNLIGENNPNLPGTEDTTNTVIAVDWAAGTAAIKPFQIGYMSPLVISGRTSKPDYTVRTWPTYLTKYNSTVYNIANATPDTIFSLSPDLIEGTITETETETTDSVSISFPNVGLWGYGSANGMTSVFNMSHTAGVAMQINLYFVKSISTGVRDITPSKSAVSVTYYNLAGQQSAQPFEGVNIVRTAYSDGSVSSAKRLFR